MKQYQYRVKEEVLDQFAELYTQVDGVSVTLHGREGQRIRQATANRPERVETVPMATQEQLKKLFEENHPYIQEIEVQADKQTESKASGK